MYSQDYSWIYETCFKNVCMYLVFTYLYLFSIRPNLITKYVHEGPGYLQNSIIFQLNETVFAFKL